MSLVKVKSKYQIVIPEDVRKKVKVDIGDTLEIMEKDGAIVLKPVMVIEKISGVFLD